MNEVNLDNIVEKEKKTLETFKCQTHKRKLEILQLHEFHLLL